MRAASLALLAVATGPTNAFFCFVKSGKCLPGVELSLDYDEIPELLGVTKSSTLTETATQTPSGASAPIPTVDTTALAVPTSVGPGLLDDIFPHRIHATPGVPVTPLASPDAAAAVAEPGSLGNVFPRSYEETPPVGEYISRAGTHRSAEHPIETRVAPPAYVNSPDATLPLSARPQYTEHALPSEHAAEHMTRPLIVIPSALPPTYHAPELLPIPNDHLESPRFNLTTSEVRSAYTKVHSSASHAAEIPSKYVTHASEVFSVVTKESRSSISAYTINTLVVSQPSSISVATLPAKYSTAPAHHSPAPTAPSKSERPASSIHEPAASKYVPNDVVDVTTTVTKWVTVTPTHTVVLPQTTVPQKNHTVILPRPTIPQKETPEVISLTKTIDVLVPPTWLSLATAATFTASEMHTSSCSSGHHKTGMYPLPSNATTIQSMNYVAPSPTKPTKPTIYVTPLPAETSSAWTQDPQKPVEYTGAAAANSLDVLFVLAAGVAAVMVL